MPDPHGWQDLGLGQHYVRNITAGLIAADPAGEVLYRRNAEAYAARLAALDQWVRAEIAKVPAARRKIVTSHDAFGYFATGFDLTILGSVAAGDAVSPGAARIAALRAALVDAGAVCIFPEVNHPDAYISLVADGSDLRRGRALDPAGVMNPGKMVG